LCLESFFLEKKNFGLKFFFCSQKKRYVAAARGVLILEFQNVLEGTARNHCAT